jgi:hypothetical protein
MNIIFPLVSILKKFCVAVFYKLMVTERASEMAKLIGCLEPAEPGKHPKKSGSEPSRVLNTDYIIEIFIKNHLFQTLVFLETFVEE